MNYYGNFQMKTSQTKKSYPTHRYEFPMVTVHLKLFKLSNNIQNKNPYCTRSLHFISILTPWNCGNKKKIVGIREKVKFPYLHVSWILFNKLIWPLISPPDFPISVCTFSLLSVPLSRVLCWVPENIKLFQAPLTLPKLFFLLLWWTLKAENGIKLSGLK